MRRVGKPFLDELEHQLSENNVLGGDVNELNKIPEM